MPQHARQAPARPSTTVTQTRSQLQQKYHMKMLFDNVLSLIVPVPCTATSKTSCQIASSTSKGSLQDANGSA
jgi:hypothetical protein